MNTQSIKPNLSGVIAQRLSPPVVALLRQAAEFADAAKQDVYLVGGAVRDLLLQNPIEDIDLSVSGDAIALAQQLAAANGGKLKNHPLFNTANLQIGNLNVDVAMLRAETYARPGALPSVTPGTLETDLFRRDFTINAMAVKLNKKNYGELVDIYGGQSDLDAGLIRVLHPQSFADDATRIWRAVRYETRLGFEIEPETKVLLKSHRSFLDTVGGFRVGNELALVLQEKEPEKILHRLQVYGVLSRVHPSLKIDRWITRIFPKVRAVSGGKAVNPDVYLALLVYRLSRKELLEIIKYLRLTKGQQRLLDRSRDLSLDLYDPSGTYVEISRLLSLA